MRPIDPSRRGYLSMRNNTYPVVSIVFALVLLASAFWQPGARDPRFKYVGEAAVFAPIVPVVLFFPTPVNRFIHVQF